MQKILIGAVVMATGLFMSANASAKIDLTKYNNIEIEKNLSKAEMNAYKRDAKAMGIKGIANPTFSCKDAGYTKKYIMAEGTMYGTKRKDGNINVSGEGDFKVYSFIKYFKDGNFCVEKTYAKGDSRYGKGSFALLAAY